MLGCLVALALFLLQWEVPEADERKQLASGYVSYFPLFYSVWPVSDVEYVHLWHTRLDTSFMNIVFSPMLIFNPYLRTIFIIKSVSHTSSSEVARRRLMCFIIAA